MITTVWTRELLALRLAADAALDRATHLPAVTRAQLHLDLLNTTTAVDAGQIATAEACDAFSSIRERLTVVSEPDPSFA